MEQFLQRILQEIMKKIILGTSDAWSVVRLDKWTSERAWYIIDLRISSKYLQDSLAAFCVFVFSLFPLKKPSWKLNRLHIFAISSSSRHEKRCQILERLSRNILSLVQSEYYWPFSNPFWETSDWRANYEFSQVQASWLNTLSNLAWFINWPKTLSMNNIF